MTSLRAVPGFVLELVRALLIVAVATGLLYLVEPLERGLDPSVADSLPLDELPGHDSVSLWTFAVVWILVAWAARTLTARSALSVWLQSAAVGICVYATAVVSIAVVRQISVAAALYAALSVPASYLAGGLFAGASILHGRKS